MCPPRPGSREIASATSTPAIGSTTSAHHRGAPPLYPTAWGRCVYTSCWIWYVNSRKHHVANETITPTIATSTSSTTYCRLRIVAAACSAVSGGGAAAGSGAVLDIRGL